MYYFFTIRKPEMTNKLYNLINFNYPTIKINRH